MAGHSSATSQFSRRDLLRLGGAAAVATTAAPLASGCTTVPDAGGGGGKGSFTLYTSANHVYDAWKDVVEQIEKDHEVTVNWQKFNWADMKTKLQADFSAGNVPDLVEQNGGAQAVNFAIAGEAMALDDYIAADGKELGYPDDWQAAAVESWQHEGKTYGIQLQMTCLQPFYNKQMLDEAGITELPTTWDEFLAAAKKMTGDKVHGFAAHQLPFYGWPWFVQNGVSYFDSTSGEFLTPHNAAVEAMQFQADLVHKHKVSPVPVPSSDPSPPRNLLIAKRAASIISGPWDLKPIREASDLKVVLGPPLKRKEMATVLAGSGMMIPAKSKHPDIAWDMTKRMASLETELKLTEEAGQTMARKSWGKQPEVTSDPQLAAVAKAIPHALYWHGDLAATGKVNRVDDAFKAFYQACVLQNKPAEAEIEKFLAAAKKAVGS